MLSKQIEIVAHRLPVFQENLHMQTPLHPALRLPLEAEDFAQRDLTVNLPRTNPLLLRPWAVEWIYRNKQ